MWDIDNVLVVWREEWGVIATIESLEGHYQVGGSLSRVCRLLPK
jgi:hypothetical protein